MIKFFISILIIFCAICNISFASQILGYDDNQQIKEITIQNLLNYAINPFALEDEKRQNNYKNLEKTNEFIKQVNTINDNYLKIIKNKKENYIIASNRPRKGVDKYSDLSNKYITIDKTKMNKIISVWENRNGYVTPFHNNGIIFIKASKKSGLDPLYIFAHACVESAWGKSYYAKHRQNYFGINAIDHSPDNAYKMGNSMEEGIVNGAVWISNNYYNKGAVSLNSMIHGNKRYASDANWMNKIAFIWNQSYSIYSNIN